MKTLENNIKQLQLHVRNLSYAGKSIEAINGFKNGYNQAIEDNEDKLFTIEQVQAVLDGFTGKAAGCYIKTNFIELLEKEKLRNEKR